MATSESLRDGLNPAANHHEHAQRVNLKRKLSGESPDLDEDRIKRTPSQQNGLMSEYSAGVERVAILDAGAQYGKVSIAGARATKWLLNNIPPGYRQTSERIICRCRLSPS